MRKVLQEKGYSYQNLLDCYVSPVSDICIRRFEFPLDTYSDNDKMLFGYSDRAISHDRDYISKCFQTHTDTGDQGFGKWSTNAKPEEIISFLRDFFKVNQSIKWTGFRIMGSVGCDGYLIWTFELFWKNPFSNTTVSS